MAADIPYLETTALPVKPWLGGLQIQWHVRELARKVQFDFYPTTTRQNPLHVVVVMDAAVYFAAEFSHNLSIWHQMHFLRPRDYIDFGNQPANVLILDTICDTGGTLTNVASRVFHRNYCIRTCALIVKAHATPYPDYYAFEVPSNEFVLGYGLDYRGLNRGLPILYKGEMPNASTVYTRGEPPSGILDGDFYTKDDPRTRGGGEKEGKLP